MGTAYDPNDPNNLGAYVGGTNTPNSAGQRPAPPQRSLSAAFNAAAQTSPLVRIKRAIFKGVAAVVGLTVLTGIAVGGGFFGKFKYDLKDRQSVNFRLSDGNVFVKPGQDVVMKAHPGTSNVQVADFKAETLCEARLGTDNSHMANVTMFDGQGRQLTHTIKTGENIFQGATSCVPFNEASAPQQAQIAALRPFLATAKSLAPGLDLK
jgi:hypothetical protein